MNVFIHTLSRLAMISVICGALSGCGDSDDLIIPGPGNGNDDCPIPKYPFQLGDEDMVISSDGETITAEPFGSNGEDFVTLSYIADYPFAHNDVNARKYLLQGHVGSMAISDFYNVFSVAEYNLSLGLPDCVNSPEIEYVYGWIKVKCYKGDGDNHTQLVISAEENTTGQRRDMFLYFTSPSLGAVSVTQLGER